MAFWRCVQKVDINECLWQDQMEWIASVPISASFGWKTCAFTVEGTQRTTMFQPLNSQQSQLQLKKSNGNPNNDKTNAKKIVPIQQGAVSNKPNPKSGYFEIFFHQFFRYDGERLLEVKILKNVDPIWGFHPNFFSKIQLFLVITHIEGVIGVRSLAARSVYETYYYKLLTFQPRFWVENPFGVMIF